MIHVGFVQATTASTCTLALPNPPAGCGIAIHRVLMTGSTSAGVTHGTLQWNSIDPTGSGTRTFVFPLAASLTNLYQIFDYKDLPIRMWRSTDAGYSIVLTAVGGTWINGNIMMVWYEFERLAHGQPSSPAF